MIRSIRRAAVFLLLAAGSFCLGAAEPALAVVWPSQHPGVACNAEELQRLRQAWQGKGKEHEAVAARVRAGDRAIKEPLVFPPRGGQHNQWYQCETCQIGLKTVDPTHHRCPKCGQVYTGHPYDDVVFSRQHGQNLSRMNAAAWAYAITGEAKYAAFARSVLLGYAERYRAYPYHTNSRRLEEKKETGSGGHLFEQSLNEASAMATEIAPAYDLVFNAPCLAPADHAAIRDGLILPMLRNIDRVKCGEGNWQSWHNAAMLLGGAVLKDRSWIDKAIDDPRNGFRFQMGVSVTSDGMWYENSWAYHFYTLSSMTAIAEGARHLGIDLWSDRRLRSMYLASARYVMPDGSLPRLGDDPGVGSGAISGALEFAWHACHDPAMAPYLSSTPTWDSVMLGRKTGEKEKEPVPQSLLLPGAGHAILRQSGPAGLVALLSFGPYGGYHGHLDKLSFVFFGYDAELGVDSGRAASQAYRLPIHRNWYKASLGHNLVLVDRKSQAPASGTLELFDAAGPVSAALARCDAAYPGISQRRLLVLFPEYLLVLDLLASDQDHRYDWIYHNRGTEAKTSLPLEKAAPDPAFPGREYILNARQGQVEGPVRVQFPDKKLTTHLTLAGAPGTMLLLGDGPLGSVDQRVPVAIATRQGKQASFAAVLEPVAGTPPTVSDVKLSEQTGTWTVEITRPGGNDEVILDRQGLRVRRQGTLVLAKKFQ